MAVLFGDCSVCCDAGDKDCECGGVCIVGAAEAAGDEAGVVEGEAV